MPHQETHETAGPEPAPPPQEPPLDVRNELLWRVAVRLFDDHSGGPSARCRRCREPWPCSGRRLAELGLTAARG